MKIYEFRDNKISVTLTKIRAVEDGGADAISMINTLTGSKIDIYKRKYVLANRTGDLSGPAIKPIAVRMISQVCELY